MGEQQVKLMKLVLLISSLVSLSLLVYAAYQENFRGEWRSRQQTYGVLLTSSSDDGTVSTFPIEPRQIYLPELGSIDRCTTCHLGVENPAMVSAELPLTRHPGDLLANHPPDKFGCTICHQGEGRATTREAAHGWDDHGEHVADVEFPLLRDQAVYTSCGRCHYEVDLYGGETDLFAGASDTDGTAHGGIDESSLGQTLPGANSLFSGKRLVIQSGCLGCHKYRGRGGLLGPDLTYVGDKTKHDFDFSHVAGEHTVEQWLYEHFMLPGEVSPNTLMPDMGLSQDQARSLALYMMGLHRKSAPASHTPRPKRSSRIAGAAVRGETLYGMFCSACHGADGYGTTMRTGLWPTDADPWGHEWDVRSVVVERRSEQDVVVPSLNHPDTLATVSDEYLRNIIALGRPGTKMPAWRDEGGLSEDEITLLVDYIRSWQRPVGDIRSVSASRGDARIGEVLYRANCAACHGVTGEGGIGVSLNSPTFLAVASDSFLRDTIMYGRPNTAMPAWREFDSQEVSDLLAFIRRWQPARSDVATTLALCDGPENFGVSARIGKTLYQANCVTCHGAGGAGDLGPSLNTQAFLTVVPDSYLIDTIISGRPGTGMPSWRHLANEDVASIVRFIRTWQTEPSKTPAWHDQQVERGDWDTGRHLFAGQCASCHGVDGEGAAGPQLNNPVFLANATDVMLRAWITDGKEGTPMRGFRKGGQGIAELSGRQIEDIVAYLRFLERKETDEVVRVAKSPNGRPRLGRSSYARNCAACHGPRGEGASGPALSNPNFLRFASDGFLMATLALGRHGTAMRPVKRGPQSILELSSDEVNNVVAYLRSWENTSPLAVAGTKASSTDSIPHRFVVPWSLGRGRTLFTSYCAGCHGNEGRGMWAPELNNEGFLASATDGFLQATIVRGRRGTAMRPFGRGGQGVAELSDHEIDDIVAYIRHWSTQAPAPASRLALPTSAPALPGVNPARPSRDVSSRDSITHASNSQSALRLASKENRP